jgi:hypothetical protein
MVYTFVSLFLRLKNLLGSVTRAKKKKKDGVQGYLADEKTPPPRTLEWVLA